MHDEVVNDNSRAKLQVLVEVLDELVCNDESARSFREIEAALLAATNEAVRIVLERRLQRISSDLSREVLIDGVLYRHHQLGSATYFSLCGPLRVDRATYRLVGERNGPTKVPLDLVAGIIERGTPAFAYSLAQSYAKAPIRSVEADLVAAHRRPPSRSTLDRMAKALGSAVHRCSERLVNVVRKQEKIPSETVAVNLGLDRTTVPMQESERGELRVKYRMAYVGTVCFTDADANPVCTRRYASSAHQGPSSIVRRMMADLRHALRKRPGLNIGIVQDGAPELWNILREALRGEPLLKGKKWRETYDFYHVMEHVARLLEIVADKEERAVLLPQWRERLLLRNNTIEKIDAWLRRRGFALPRDTRKFEEFLRLYGAYFVCPQNFRYASLKRLGLQKGSGVTEGACKSLVTMRAKRSGQRWLRTGIDAVLAIKSVVDSERMPPFWELFAARYCADLCAA
jgi:hypothetical protein